MAGAPVARHERARGQAGCGASWDAQYAAASAADREGQLIMRRATALRLTGLALLLGAAGTALAAIDGHSPVAGVVAVALLALAGLAISRH